jgi:hypothetical protein
MTTYEDVETNNLLDYEVPESDSVCDTDESGEVSYCHEQGEHVCNENGLVKYLFLRHNQLLFLRTPVAHMPSSSACTASSNRGWYLYKHATTTRSLVYPALPPARTVRTPLLDTANYMIDSAPVLASTLFLCFISAMFAACLMRQYQRDKYNTIVSRLLGHYANQPTSAVVPLSPPLVRAESTLTASEPSHASFASLASITTPPTPYQSRFLTDFKPIACLGRGGFGLVLECRNTFDDQYYAVKRVPVTNTDRGRERVMREVKLLAKLDHPNIVRFYQTWIEQPPAEWQQAVDEEILANWFVCCFLRASLFLHYIPFFSSVSPNIELHTNPPISTSYGHRQTDESSASAHDTNNNADRSNPNDESCFSIPPVHGVCSLCCLSHQIFVCRRSQCVFGHTVCAQQSTGSRTFFEK